MAPGHSPKEGADHGLTLSDDIMNFLAIRIRTNVAGWKARFITRGPTLAHRARKITIEVVEAVA